MKRYNFKTPCNKLNPKRNHCLKLTFNKSTKEIKENIKRKKKYQGKKKAGYKEKRTKKYIYEKILTAAR